MTLQVQELNSANCKTYLVASGREAVLIDPVRERVAAYKKALESRGLRLERVIETHTHADHLMINREIKDALGAPVVMHESSPSPLVDVHVVDGDTIELGDAGLEVLHTPGHTPDSVCLRGPGVVFTGDTLLIGGSGRTDFPGGDAGAQFDAVTGRLFALEDDTVVWPAHDYQGNTRSTIAAERRDNQRFAGKTRDEYVRLMANLGLPFPDRIQEALQINQSGFEVDEVGFPSVPDIARVESIAARDLSSALRSSSPPLVIDVREPEEFVGDVGHIEGALLVPMDALERRLPKLAGYVDREIVVVCRAGARSASACVILQRAGFKRVLNLHGGMVCWRDADLPVHR